MRVTGKFRYLMERSLTLLAIVGLMSASVSVHAAAKFDQSWINKFPGGKNIKLQTGAVSTGATVRGKAAIDGKVLELAAGSLKTGHIVMWRVRGFRLSSVHDRLDVFPLNEIAIPDGLMVLARGNIKNMKVDQLPGELRGFALKVLAPGDLLSLKPGLNIYGRIKPAALPKNVRSAFHMFGADRATILLGGAIGNILTKPRAPVVDLYARLPDFRFPHALRNILAGSQRPTLFIGTSAAAHADPVDTSADAKARPGRTSADSKAAHGGKPAEKPSGGKSGLESVRFGIIDDLHMKVGKSEIDFAAKFFLKLEHGNIGVDVALIKNKWNNAMGIRHLDLRGVRGELGVSPKGGVSFGLRGGLLLDRKLSTLAIASAINPATGLPNPDNLLFYLKAPEISLKQYMKIVDIFVGSLAGRSELARKAANPGLYKILQLDKLPEVALRGLKKGEDLEIVVSGQNASDPALGVGGMGARVKARLLVWGSELGRADVTISKLGFAIAGEADIRKIGPLKMHGTGVKTVIDAKAGLTGAPHFRLKGHGSLLGVSNAVDIELSSRRIRLAEKMDLAGLGEGSLVAETTGRNLASVRAFKITGRIEQDLAAKGAEYVVDGIRAAYHDVSEQAVKAISQRIKKSSKFFDLKRVELSGTASLRHRDSLRMSAVATVAGREERVSAQIRSIDKTQVAHALSGIFREFGRQLFAFKMPGFDKDIVRKRSDELYFYEGKDCTQEIVGTAAYDFGGGKLRVVRADKVKWFQNDEARSLLVRKPRKGASIVLYDSSSGSVTDDLTVISILKDSGKGFCIGGFEKSRTAGNGVWQMTHLHRNGLDGKVSRIVVSPKTRHSAFPPDIIFYEGKNCAQSVKGHARSDKKAHYNCKKSTHCVEDEIKSAKLMRWGASWVRGRTYSFHVYDDPDGKNGDDWAKVIVTPSKIAGGSDCVGSFEGSRTKASFKVEYHKPTKALKVKGLDGKVSRISVTP